MPYISPFKIKQAIQKLDTGEIIAYPTEAIYGLGCDPLNQEAVFKLLALKKRSHKKGLILIASSLSQLEPYLKLNQQILSRMQASGSEPITWIIPVQAWVPNWLTGTHSTLAVRVTAHPIAKLLCEHNGHPIVSTSANIQARPPAICPWMVSRNLNNQDLFIVPGEIGNMKQATSIYDAVSYQKLR